MSFNYKFPKIDAFSRITNDSVIVKITLGLFFPIILGFVFHYLPISSLYKLIGYSILMIIIIGLSVYTTDKYNERMAVLLSLLTGSVIWYYIFINKYRLEVEEKKIGKKSFICNPNGLCKTDGTNGPFNGLNDYTYNPSSQPSSKDTKIPHTEFDVKIPNEMTYMFWLKIDYNSWKSSNFYNKNKIIIIKGADISTGDLAVYASPAEDLLQINIGNENKPVTISTDFPFDKWVHYTITAKENIAEVYKNATLEKSVVLDKSINLKKTPLYIGKSNNSINNNFPGQLLYLTYINKNLTPEKIYIIYQNEYTNISNMDMSLNNINDDNSNPSKNCNECNQDIQQNIENIKTTLKKPPKL